MYNNNLNNFMQAIMDSQRSMMETASQHRDQLSLALSSMIHDHLDASIERLQRFHDLVSDNTSGLKSEILSATIKNAIDQHQLIKDRWTTHTHQANTHKQTLRRLAMGTMAAFGVMSAVKAAPALGHEEGSSRAHMGAATSDRGDRSSLMGLRGISSSTASASPIVSLGKPDVAAINLSNPRIDDVLTAMVVDPKGTTGRYTIGTRSIVPALKVVNEINAGDIDPRALDLSQLAPLLICVSAEYKRQLPGGMTKDGSAMDCLAENTNVLYNNGSLVGMDGDYEAARLKSSDLLAAFSKVKAAFASLGLLEIIINSEEFGLNMYQEGLKRGDRRIWKEYITKLQELVKSNPEISAAMKEGAAALTSSSIDSIQAGYSRLPKGAGKSSFVLVQEVDAKMPSASAFAENAVQQVASQFNFLESTSANYSEPVRYLADMTQGPQASLGSPGALFERDYAVVHSKLGDQPLFEGLTPSQYAHGYLQLARMSEAEKAAFLTKLERNVGNLNVLVQEAVPQFSKEKMTQVFVAAPSFQGFFAPASGSIDEKICELLVASQYRATAQAAAIQSVKTGKPVNLHLTLVGQGAFNNPESVLKKALKEVGDTVQGFNVNVFIHGFSTFDIAKIQRCIPGEMSGAKIMSKDEFFKK